LVIAPAQIDGAVAKKAQGIAENAIKSFPGAGIFGVEMFVMEDGKMMIGIEKKKGDLCGINLFY
jgi:phosphoribosylaminoimidazole carboxylase